MTSTLYDVFEDKTDEDLFEKGKWFPINADSSIKLRSAHSDHVIAVRKRLEEPFAKYHELKIPIPKEHDEELVYGVLAASIVDWKGTAFVDDEGKPIKCNQKNALTFLKDPKLKKFAAYILNIVGDADMFQKEYEEKAEKN